jgi:anti-sigma B factor antagonist
MSFVGRHSAGAGGREDPTGADTSRSSSNGRRRIGSARAAELGIEPFAVEVRRRDAVVIVEPRGELDAATVETLHAALDGIERAGHVVLDLRGLTFMDSTGLHLLHALHQRAQRDGFRLTLVPPAARIGRAIELTGLDKVLPFAAAVDGDPAGTASGRQDA